MPAQVIDLDGHRDYIVELYWEKNSPQAIAKCLKDDFHIDVKGRTIERRLHQWEVHKYHKTANTEEL